MSLPQWCPQIISQILDNPPPLLPEEVWHSDVTTGVKCGMSLLRTSIAICSTRGILLPLLVDYGVLSNCEVQTQIQKQLSRGQVHSLSSSNSFFRERAKIAIQKCWQTICQRRSTSVHLMEAVLCIQPKCLLHGVAGFLLFRGCWKYWSGKCMYSRSPLMTVSITRS